MSIIIFCSIKAVAGFFAAEAATLAPARQRTRAGCEDGKLSDSYQAHIPHDLAKMVVTTAARHVASLEVKTTLFLSRRPMIGQCTSECSQLPTTIPTCLAAKYPPTRVSWLAEKSKIQRGRSLWEEAKPLPRSEGNVMLVVSTVKA